MFSIEQAPAIPLSPSSPPETGLKQRAKRRLSEEKLRSPAASPLMSVATKSYVSGYGTVQASMEEGSSYTSASQPTSAPSFTQQSTQPLTTTSHSFPTPVSSVTESSSVTDIQDYDRHRDKRQRLDSELEEGNDTQITTHPLDQEETTAQGDEAPVEAGLATRHEREEEGPSHANPQEEINRTFLLCKSTLRRISPDPREHLIARYGLSDLQKTVARIDPVNGDKINKLRKSYEGQIKGFALAGRNKPHKTEMTLDGRGRLLTMTQWTPGYNALLAQQQETSTTKISIHPDFVSKLRTAVALQPGGVRNNAMWEEVLGHERSRPGDTPTTATATKQNNATAAATAAMIPPRGPVNGTSRAALIGPGRDVIRPRRQGKKRSYADDSFEGYGDGFVDDDLDVGGAGTYTDEDDDDGDGNGGSARKKRRKFEEGY